MTRFTLPGMGRGGGERERGPAKNREVVLGEEAREGASCPSTNIQAEGIVSNTSPAREDDISIVSKATLTLDSKPESSRTRTMPKPVSYSTSREKC